MLDAASLESVACPVCGLAGPEHSKVWGEENGYTARKCNNCGLVFVSPRPSLTEITEGNRIGEHRTKTGGPVVVRSSRKSRAVERYANRIRSLMTTEIAAGAPLQWLDVGAGYGEVIEAAQRVLPQGSSVSGIEPMEVKARDARERGLDVTETPLSEVTGTYDIVSLINVFSHIPDFEAFGRDLGRILRPGGLLLLETGNGGDLDKRSQYPDLLFLPDHLVFAGVGHMTTILSRLGFRVDQTREYRLDTPLYEAKSFLVGLLRYRRLRVSIPYTSPFRSVVYKAIYEGQPTG